MPPGEGADQLKRPNLKATRLRDWLADSPPKLTRDWAERAPTNTTSMGICAAGAICEHPAGGAGWREASKRRWLTIRRTTTGRFPEPTAPTGGVPEDRGRSRAAGGRLRRRKRRRFVETTTPVRSLRLARQATSVTSAGHHRQMRHLGSCATADTGPRRTRPAQTDDLMAVYIPLSRDGAGAARTPACAGISQGTDYLCGGLPRRGCRGTRRPAQNPRVHEAKREDSSRCSTPVTTSATIGGVTQPLLESSDEELSAR